MYVESCLDSFVVVSTVFVRRPSFWLNAVMSLRALRRLYNGTRSTTAYCAFDCGFGDCSSTGECVCDAGWGGEHCSTVVCCSPAMVFLICFVGGLVVAYAAYRTRTVYKEWKANKENPEAKEGQDGWSPKPRESLDKRLAGPWIRRSTGNSKVEPRAAGGDKSDSESPASAVSSGIPPEGRSSSVGAKLGKAMKPGQKMRHSVSAGDLRAAARSTANAYDRSPSASPPTGRRHTTSTAWASPNRKPSSSPREPSKQEPKQEFSQGRTASTASRDSKASSKQAPSGPAIDVSDPAARDAVLAVHKQMDDYAKKPLAERKQFFRTLLLEHHPDKSDSPHAKHVFQAIHGRRETFLKEP
eukprot:TRINITY_DN22042_c0_g1_i4.p1 TRINITY_DN22042_c0_g1~~TRINITY_DN22042_c0_g1_i4.p1  ORF type:complete len:356 (+),score=52.35 TRINITY_DN22042_c0_g1_i4:39-1106(+)